LLIGSDTVYPYGLETSRLVLLASSSHLLISTPMATLDPHLSDPLLSLRRAIASASPPILTTSAELSAEHATDDLTKATHLYVTQPIPQSIALSTPTRFVSAAAKKQIDLRSIYFAWQKKDVAIPEYIASAQELNEALTIDEGKSQEDQRKVLNLVFVERLDLITWLEGASEESEYIKLLEGIPTAAPTDTAASAIARAAEDSTNVASGATGGVRTVPSAAAGTAVAGSHPGGRLAKVVDPRLQEIYNGERKMGDRNSVLRGIRPTVSTDDVALSRIPTPNSFPFPVSIIILISS
jgi:parafibromin